MSSRNLIKNKIDKKVFAYKSYVYKNRIGIR